MAVGVRQEVDMVHSGTVYVFSLHTAYCRTLNTYRATYGLVKNPVNAKGTPRRRSRSPALAHGARAGLLGSASAPE
jgi:hypothetical protein